MSARRSDEFPVRIVYDVTPDGSVTSNVCDARFATVGRWVCVLASAPPPTSRPVNPASWLATV